ncbi:MAG: hypothetical protein LKM30_06355 [Bacilli bacterium]|jgi:hypothetical protein|nr:hypothetical protein [Bacilli bacterium]
MTDILLSFSKDKVPSYEEIVSSPIMAQMTQEYLTNIKTTDPSLALIITKTFGEKDPAKGLIGFYKRLLKEDYRAIKEEYFPFTLEKVRPLDTLDAIYDVWRKKERYAYIDRGENDITSFEFLSLTDHFSEAIIMGYRTIYENILGGEQTVYRQLPSGINAGFILNSFSDMTLPKDLSFLKATKAIEALAIRPPFICSSKENTRTGVFFEKDARLEKGHYNPEDFYLSCILIKGQVGYIYVHKEYLSFLVALGNLFEMVKPEAIKGTKPGFIVVFGADCDSDLTYYYKDEGVYVGLVPAKGHIAYFGYLKKIVLTLHNLSQIDQGRLPIHGAGIEVTMNDGKIYNVVILGDSGAGKSETIEALRKEGKGRVEEIKTIFDDMGTFVMRDDEVMCLGTETGAFVRLDDLDKGYSLKSVDRAIYINTEKVNSRVVIPIETYSMTKTFHRVDVFLLADNFTDDLSGLIPYPDEKVAIAEFIKGERVAKGTTSEKGKVSTFFANPFGPLQREKDCEPLIQFFFDKLYEEKVYVGRLYTRLSIDPVNGPLSGAKGLFGLLDRLEKED